MALDNLQASLCKQSLNYYAKELYKENNQKA